MDMDQFRQQWARECGRRAAVLGSIRAHLEEQPSPRTVRTAARRWCAQITALADDIVTALTSTERNQ